MLAFLNLQLLGKYIGYRLKTLPIIICIYEKPTTVRIVILCLEDMLKYKAYLAPIIKENLSRINPNKYKDSMSPLIIKDTARLNSLIDELLK